MADLSITLTVHNACSVGLCLCRKIDAVCDTPRPTSDSPSKSLRNDESFLSRSSIGRTIRNCI